MANAKRPKSKLKRVFTIASSFAEAEAADIAYWKSQTPMARLRALEMMRRVNYGAAATGRLQRVLEVVQRKKS